jgi:diguanylate cyclase (GGDEF)-like protein
VLALRRWSLVRASVARCVRWLEDRAPRPVGSGAVGGRSLALRWEMCDLGLGRRHQQGGVRHGRAAVGVDARWETTKRRVYLWCLLVATPTIPLVMWVRWGEEPLLPLTYSVLLSVLLVTTAGLLLNRVSTSQAERAVLTTIPILWLIRLAGVLYLQDDLSVAAATVTQSIGPGFAILAVVAYLALDTRRALQLGVGFVVGGMVLVLPRVVLEVRAVGFTSDVLGLLRPGITSGVIVTLLYALAVLKERVAVERSAARVNAELARTDQLTGMRNRRAILERLTELTALSERHDRPLSVALVDLDHFKRINDDAGHLVGDRVLREVTATIDRLLRTPDVIGRWGGDELLVVLPETSGTEAGRSMERIARQVRREVGPAVGGKGGDAASGAVLAVTLSIGVAQRLPGDEPDDLLARADRALYRAKESGRDRVVVDGGGLTAAASS